MYRVILTATAYGIQLPLDVSTSPLRDVGPPRLRYRVEDTKGPPRVCLNVTCVQGENGKSISTIDSAQATKARDADTDSDLARSPDGKHPSALHATPSMVLRTRSTECHAPEHRRPCRGALGSS